MSRREGEKGLNHHRTGDGVTDTHIVAGGGSLVKKNVPRKHLIHYRKGNLCLNH